MKKQRAIIQWMGWYGVIAILGAYALVNFGILKPSDGIYQTLNITGALAMIIEALDRKDWQPAALNVAWALIALFGLIQSHF